MNKKYFKLFRRLKIFFLILFEKLSELNPLNIPREIITNFHNY